MSEKTGRFKVKLAPVDKTFFSMGSVIEPLCKTCENRSCQNPIEYVDVSVMGVTKKLPLYASQSGHSMVVDCEAYMRK